MGMLLRKHLTSTPIVTDERTEVKSDEASKVVEKPNKKRKSKRKSEND